jgi:hypothetical protein
MAGDPIPISYSDVDSFSRATYFISRTRMAAVKG